MSGDRRTTTARPARAAFPGPRHAAARPRRGGFVARAFGVTAVLSAAGSGLGLLRDLLLARYFGATRGTDAFLVAWTVPETAAPLLIEDAMAFLMVPAFSLALVLREERPHGPDPVRQLVRATLPWLLLALCTLTLAAAVGAGPLVGLLAPGLADPALAVTCTRITALTVLPFGVVGYLCSMLRAHHRFTAPASIYVAYNLGILAVLLGGHALLGVRSAALGVTCGSLLMAGLLLGPVRRILPGARRRISPAPGREVPPRPDARPNRPSTSSTRAPRAHARTGAPRRTPIRPDPPDRPGPPGGRPARPAVPRPAAWC
ncbi:lipid II flippase MurJ [Kitasatospora arboriphila]